MPGVGGREVIEQVVFGWRILHQGPHGYRLFFSRNVLVNKRSFFLEVFPDKRANLVRSRKDGKIDFAPVVEEDRFIVSQHRRKNSEKKQKYRYPHPKDGQFSFLEMIATIFQ